MAKVVFLDIDGVCHQVDDPRGPFRPKCMMQLKKLVHGSGAEDGRKMMASVAQSSPGACAPSSSDRSEINIADLTNTAPNAGQTESTDQARRLLTIQSGSASGVHDA